jgi:hypothetical protein
MQTMSYIGLDFVSNRWTIHGSRLVRLAIESDYAERTKPTPIANFLYSGRAFSLSRSFSRLPLCPEGFREMNEFRFSPFIHYPSANRFRVHCIFTGLRSACEQLPAGSPPNFAEILTETGQSLDR